MIHSKLEYYKVKMRKFRRSCCYCQREFQPFEEFFVVSSSNEISLNFFTDPKVIRMTRCPVCSRECTDDLIVISEKKCFPVCSHEHGIIFIQELWRLGSVGWLKERNTANPFTIHFDYEVIENE
jgi:hypothetical protein